MKGSYVIISRPYNEGVLCYYPTHYSTSWGVPRWLCAGSHMKWQIWNPQWVNCNNRTCPIMRWPHPLDHTHDPLFSFLLAYTSLSFSIPLPFLTTPTWSCDHAHLTTPQTWETRYILLLWLYVISMIPFDLTRLDGSTGHTHSTTSDHTHSRTIDRLIDTCKIYLAVTDKSRDAAVLLCAR